MNMAGIQSCWCMDKYVIIIMDEMHVREDIVYDKHTGMYIMQVFDPYLREISVIQAVLLVLLTLVITC